MLQHFGVVPFLIFDGDYLPSKAATEADRAKRREESKRNGLELLNAGKTSQAYLEFQKAVDVTPEMARQLIDELKKTGVQYIVAPYEADAQMVYLERRGIIDGIISEDSDLLVFGAKCLLTKLDQYGNCIEINKADFCACREISLTGWSDTEFRRMAILSGCDYLASINNMGLKTAYRMVRKHKTIEKVLRMLSFDGKFFIPKGYLEAFYQAELTFLHQRVFCPKALALVLHTEPEHPIDVDAMPFIGAHVEPEIAQGVARGDLNPMTKQPIATEKRNKMVTSTTPWSSRQQTPRSASTNDVKKGKRIDTFFKAKRVPLAELDINCFTPSPSQQEALRRNSGPWAANPVPRPRISRSASEPEPPQSAPPQPRAHSGRVHIRTPTISNPRPPKRARLCEDNDVVDLPSQKVELGRSRFFASAAEPSPTAGRTARSRRSKKEEINIFSDDSVEDAMLSLPDVDGFGGLSTTRKIVVFEEKFVPIQKIIEPLQPQMEDPTGTDDSAASQDTTPSLTASTSVPGSFEQPPTPTETTPMPSPVGKLKERFALSAGAVSTPRNNGIQGLSTPVSTAPRPSRIPLAVKPNAAAAKSSAFSTKASLTPLQRLRATAANRSKLPMTPPQTPPFPFKAKSPRRSLLSKSNVPFSEVARDVMKKEVEPASIPLPKADQTENMALVAPQNGSEDLIIHDSEEEECLSPGPEGSVPRIDLGRFVYAG
jgi:exonuclease-1